MSLGPLKMLNSGQASLWRSGLFNYKRWFEFRTATHDEKCIIFQKCKLNVCDYRDTAKYPPLMKTSKLSNSLKYLTQAYLGQVPLISILLTLFLLCQLSNMDILSIVMLALLYIYIQVWHSNWHTRPLWGLCGNTEAFHENEIPSS